MNRTTLFLSWSSSVRYSLYFIVYWFRVLIAQDQVSQEVMAAAQPRTLSSRCPLPPRRTCLSSAKARLSTLISLINPTKNQVKSHNRCPRHQVIVSFIECSLCSWLSPSLAAHLFCWELSQHVRPQMIPDSVCVMFFGSTKSKVSYRKLSSQGGF